MTFEEKLRVLRALDTKKLINILGDLENKLEATLQQEAQVKNHNAGYLASATSDCAEVKQILAELMVTCPETDKNGKKLVAADREAWLVRQRKDNPDLVKAIDHQLRVAFNLENLRVDTEMAKKRLESTKAILGLRTAQIEFLKD